MPSETTKTVIVTVTFPQSGAPVFVLGGDVNSDGAVVVDANYTDTIKWNLNGNRQGTQVTFQSTPITWVESCGTKTGNTWASPPQVTLNTSTQAQAVIGNTTPHSGQLAYLYKINVAVGSDTYSYDPEVDEPAVPEG